MSRLFATPPRSQQLDIQSHLSLLQLIHYIVTSNSITNTPRNVKIHDRGVWYYYFFRPRHQCPFKARLSPGGLTLNEDVANTKELLTQQRKERRTELGQTSQGYLKCQKELARKFPPSYFKSFSGEYISVTLRLEVAKLYRVLKQLSWLREKRSGNWRETQTSVTFWRFKTPPGWRLKEDQFSWTTKGIRLCRCQLLLFLPHTYSLHFFPNAEVTSNRNELNFWHSFLARFFMPFCKVWYILLEVLALKPSK